MVTRAFLFTDIEGSTQLWERNRAAMSADLRSHDDLLRRVIADSGGTVFKTVGDAFCVVFPSVHDAVSTSISIQLELRRVSWLAQEGIRVRAAVHVGECDERDGDYFGPTLNRAARLLSAANGGQVLASEAVAILAGTTDISGAGFVSRGHHRLKDIPEPFHIYEIAHTQFERVSAELNTLSGRPNNLVKPNTTMIGRESETEELLRLLTTGSQRFLTITGSGGTGKTRIALHVAELSLDEFRDGVYSLRADLPGRGQKTSLVVPAKLLKDDRSSGSTVRLDRSSK